MHPHWLQILLWATAPECVFYGLITPALDQVGPRLATVRTPSGSFIVRGWGTFVCVCIDLSFDKTLVLSIIRLRFLLLSESCLLVLLIRRSAYVTTFMAFNYYAQARISNLLRFQHNFCCWVHSLITQGKFQSRAIGRPHSTAPFPIQVMPSASLGSDKYKFLSHGSTRLKSHDLSKWETDT